MPGITTPGTPDTAEDDFSDLWTPPAGSQILTAEAAYDALQSHAPEVLIPIGMQHICQDAKLTGTSGNDMSATFTILTRPKKAELNRGGRMVQITPGPNGKGMQTDNYQNNPVVLFNHGMDGFVFPIGRAQDKPGKSTLKVNPRQMSGTVHFSQSCPYAESIFGMVDDRLLGMASAGFNVEQLIPLEVDMPTLAAGVQATNKFGYDATQSDMVEWSVVAIGADAGALRQCVETGKWKGRIIKPQILPILRQYAEKPHAWTMGIGPGLIQAGSPAAATATTQRVVAPEPSESQVAAIDRLSNEMQHTNRNIDNLTKQIGTLIENFSTVNSQAKTSLTQAETQVIPQQVQVQNQPVQPNLPSIVQQLDSVIQQAVAAAVKPVQVAQQNLAGRLDQLTGKLPLP